MRGVPIMGEATKAEQMSFGRRWWTYQQERFPVVGHGMLIAAFSFCAVSFSHQLRGETGLPSFRSAVVAFVTCFTLFAQLRIADEFKDFEEDLTYRPYRPVQRGLVTLRGLGMLFVIGCVIQLGLAIWLEARLIVLLGTTWVYLAAMSKEFFVGGWLKDRPMIYMVSHMAIMPLIDLYATGTDWIAAGLAGPPSGIGWFLAASFFNGMVIEIGRKIRTPQDEEVGVKTYSAVWGLRRAISAWWLVLMLAACCVVMSALRLGEVLPVVAAMAMMLVGAVLIGANLWRKPADKKGKRIEIYSGVWTIIVYLSLGVLTLVLR